MTIVKFSESTAQIEAICKAYPNVSIGEFTYGNPQIEHFDGDDTKLIIGKYCSIANGVTFVMGGEHQTKWLTTYPFSMFDKFKMNNEGCPSIKRRGDIIVGNDVWFGNGCKILSGTKIGNGVVIGAGSVVSGKSIPDYAIVVGNPARIVKYRFSFHVRFILKRIKWWDWFPVEVKDNLSLLCSNNYSGLVKMYFGKLWR
jgi:acetyltransferase-like isoleucine patch superfamily enzyme